MTTERPSATSRRQGHVLLVTMSTVSVSFTSRPFTPLIRAVTSASDTCIPTAPATTTPVTVVIYQLTANAIVRTVYTIRSKYVKISVDISIRRWDHRVLFHTEDLPRRVLFTISPNHPPNLNLMFLTARPQPDLLSWESAITTASVVRDSSLMTTIATRIVQLRTAEQHAGTLAACTAICGTSATTRRQASCTHIEHTTVCTTHSAVLGK